MRKYISICNKKRYHYLVEKDLIPEESIVVTSDSDLILYLENENRVFVDLWKYLDASDVQNNWNDVEVLTKIWYNNTPLENITFKSLQVCPLISYKMNFGFQAALNVRTVILKWLNTINKEDVFYICNNHQQFLNNLVFLDTDIFDSVFRYLAEGKNFKCETYSVPAELSEYFHQKKNKKRTPKSIKTIGLENILEKQKKIVFFVDDSSTEGEYNVTKEFSKTIKENTITVKYYNTNLGIPTGQYYDLVLNDIPIDIHEAESGVNDLIKDQRNFDFPTGFDFIFKNQYFHFQLNYFYNLLKQTIKSLTKFDKLIRAINPDLIFFGNSWNYEVRAMMAYSLHLGIRNMSFVHGGLTNSIGYKFRILPVSALCVSGNYIAYEFEKNGFKEDQIKLVGNPKLNDNLIDQYSNKSQSNSRRTVTFITGRGGGMAYGIINERKNRQTLTKLSEYFNRRRDLDFIIKVHPGAYDYRYIYENLTNNNSSNVNVHITKNIYEIISTSDIVVNYNYVSNTTLESLILGKPAIYYHGDSYDIQANKTIYHNFPNLCAGSILALEKLIDKILGVEGNLNVDFENLYEDLVIDKNKKWVEHINNYVEDNLNNDLQISRNLVNDPTVGRMNDLFNLIFSKEKQSSFKLSVEYFKNDKSFVKHMLRIFLKRYQLDFLAFRRILYIIFNYQLSPKFLILLLRSYLKTTS